MEGNQLPWCHRRWDMWETLENNTVQSLFCLFCHELLECHLATKFCTHLAHIIILPPKKFRFLEFFCYFLNFTVHRVQMSTGTLLTGLSGGVNSRVRFHFQKAYFPSASDKVRFKGKKVIFTVSNHSENETNRTVSTKRRRGLWNHLIWSCERGGVIHWITSSLTESVFLF